MRAPAILLILVSILACHPEQKAQREATQRVLVNLMEEVEQGRVPEPLPGDLRPFGRDGAILTFVHPRMVRMVALTREVEPLIRASMAWMSPRSWTTPQEITQCRAEADRLLGVIDANDALLEETFGEAGQRAIDAMDLPRPSREAFRRGLQEAHARNAVALEFLALYRERTACQRALLAFLETHLERMDDLRPLFPTPEEGATYRRLVGEEKVAMARVQEKVAALARSLGEMKARQRELLDSMKER